MDFEEFCAAAISTHQLEALEGWEQIVSAAFENFELEGNRVISVEELARVFTILVLQETIHICSFYHVWPLTSGDPLMQELNLGPSAYSVLRDWIRSSDGKLSLLGYAKFLHGVTHRNSNTRQR